ncbi:MAG: HEAT repeat domain-containing protein [Proteobacteria bacterium]|nr:HEAT repeat domain-containing protein [Pseudomonadota bacterium]
MRSRNAVDAEGGFLVLQRIASNRVAELLAEFETETDEGVRCWLLELIGEARSPAGFDLFCEQFAVGRESLRNWGIRGLQLLATPEARSFLYERGLPRTPA